MPNLLAGMQQVDFLDGRAVQTQAGFITAEFQFAGEAHCFSPFARKGLSGQ